MTKSILSFNETLEFMNVSKSFLYKLTSKREIKFYKPNNGKLYFKVTDLEEWMLRNEKISKYDLEEKILNNKESKNGSK
jgi:excisionase family DNA binding protein